MDDFLERLLRTFSGESQGGPGWGVGPSPEVLDERERQKRALEEAYKRQYSPGEVDQYALWDEIYAGRKPAVAPELERPDYELSEAMAGLRPDLRGRPSRSVAEDADAAISSGTREQADADTIAKLKEMVDAKVKMERQKSFMEETPRLLGGTPELLDYDKGIAMGVNIPDSSIEEQLAGDPGGGPRSGAGYQPAGYVPETGYVLGPGVTLPGGAEAPVASMEPGAPSAADQLRKIRDQAYQMGGGKGPRGAGGGTFSQGTMTPEIAAREQELYADNAGIPMRDAIWESRDARQRRGPQGQALASEKILGLQRQRSIDQEQSIRNKLVESLGDGTGKIPFEKAMQLEAAGIPIPYGARGMAPQEYDAMMQQITSGVEKDLNRALAAQEMGTQQELVSPIIGFSSYIQQKAIEIDALVQSGRMTKDEAARLLDQIMKSEAQASNAIKANQILFGGQQPQPAGE